MIHRVFGLLFTLGEGHKLNTTGRTATAAISIASRITLCLTVFPGKKV